ncbi:hypothetical protein RN001_015719 [Aquatica leii]|uniref:Myb/SANT-like DNA-binding domain-containing protein n=1 Tax=Aquatica leii TaxID=1421715 RepID=A0AAN7PXN8_9COLE|nr:hypothetical protein RN001_015719 [Aquatica leii]
MDSLTNYRRPELVDDKDPESGLQYDLLLSDEDFVRAQEDQHFLTSLVFHAKANRTAENGESPCNTSISEDQDQNSKTNYAWKYNQVVELIKSMSSHMDDLNHPKKRKQVFEHVANDLLSLQFEVTSVMVQNKWNSLLKSYRKVKDNQNRTGRGPSRFNFFELMDEVLGSKPTNSCSHSNNSSTPESSNQSSCSTPTPESSDQNFVKKAPKQQKLKRDYRDYKREELVNKQKRHEQKLALEREKIQLETRKLDLLEKYLK